MQVLNFKQFLEMGEVMTADVSGIQLRRTDNGYKYVFNDDDGEKYGVYFYEEGVPIGGKRVSGFSIEFEGPAGMSLTNKYKANQVYRQLMMAVKKLIEELKPNALNFSGATDEQTIMYDVFYKRFLSQAYKRVSKYNYISNEFFEKTKVADPQLHQLIQRNIADADEVVTRHISQLRQNKVVDRDERKQMAARTKNMAGKIAWAENAKLIYIKSIMGDTALAYRYDTISNSIVGNRFITQSIKPFNQYPMGFPAATIKKWVDGFVAALRQEGIAIQGYYEG